MSYITSDVLTLPHLTQTANANLMPRFAHPIGNVTVAVGRDASLPCAVENLGPFKVSFLQWL